MLLNDVQEFGCNGADWRPRTSAILLKPIMVKKRIQSGFVTIGLLLGPFCMVGVSQDEVVQSAAIKILQAKCETCHGSSQISGLDLRKRESVLKGGLAGPALVPGNAGESLLYRAAAHEGELKMPPGSQAPLPDEELATLRKWINEGAVWPAAPVRPQSKEPEWWSFKNLRRPALPQSATAQPGG